MNVVSYAIIGVTSLVVDAVFATALFKDINHVKVT